MCDKEKGLKSTNFQEDVIWTMTFLRFFAYNIEYVAGIDLRL